MRRLVPAAILFGFFASLAAPPTLATGFPRTRVVARGHPRAPLSDKRDQAKSPNA